MKTLNNLKAPWIAANFYQLFFNRLQTLYRSTKTGPDFIMVLCLNFHEQVC